MIFKSSETLLKYLMEEVAILTVYVVTICIVMMIVV